VNRRATKGEVAMGLLRPKDVKLISGGPGEKGFHRSTTPLERSSPKVSLGKTAY